MTFIIIWQLAPFSNEISSSPSRGSAGVVSRCEDKAHTHTHTHTHTHIHSHTHGRIKTSWCPWATVTLWCPPTLTPQNTNHTYPPGSIGLFLLYSSIISEIGRAH